MSDDKTEEIKRNILSTSQWTRILFMAFYAVACWVLTIVLSFIIAAQILVSLITGQDNESLRKLGKTLADYFHDALSYLVYATDVKPPPFTEDEDDDDDDDDEPIVRTTPANDAGPESAGPAPREPATGGDDVFADMSFTDASENAAEPDSTDDHSVDFTVPEPSADTDTEAPDDSEEHPDDDRKI